MRKIEDLDEVKKIELGILKYIHKVCEKNNLRYYIAGGTLLGAVRHKGFIPWDDDIDILMPRKDYEKMIRIIEGEKNPIYSVLSINRGHTKNYYYPFARVVDSRTQIKITDLLYIKDQGLFVDVFPIDGLPGDMKVNEKYFDFMERYYKVWSNFRMTNIKVIKSERISRFIARLLAKNINVIARIFKIRNSKYIGCTVNGFGKREIMDKKVFAKRVLLEFEGSKFYAPIGYDEYLKRLYNDYMKIPPKTQQKRIMFGIWWKE